MFSDPDNAPTVLSMTSQAEIERRGLSRKTEVIDSARIPIVKVRDKVSGIMIDISFAAASALVTRALINELITRYPAVRPLVLVLKYFLIQVSARQSSRCSAYAR
jgi:DNA polymerase sigma